MIEFVLVALAVIVLALIYYSPKMSGRGHHDPTEKSVAEAKTSMVFLTDDESRAAEYEHRFSASRTGMMMDKQG